MERPELDSLLSQLDRPHSFTVLLGEPGSGKSALLAHVAEGLSKNGVALLALKADLLPPDLGTLAALDEYLGTPGPVAESLKELAESRTVVFLIDQMDAVSELMVQRTSRLTVLLSLINRLRGVENLHILLSCRTFEFKHDLRLSTLKPESVTLHDPPLASVEGLLAATQIDCTNWPSDVKELLRRPQHLNFFIQHLSQDGTPAFRSYQAMMESVFHARISRPFGEKAACALETIAGAMSDEENLWLPVSRFERTYGRDIDRLVAAGLLSYSTDSVRVGFRHQTIFDFVRARAFASGVASLAQHVLERQDSLFVRPILWSTLHYLREADRDAYRREVQILWTNSELRQHIRFLMIAFLGQVSDPDFIEIGLIRPALSDLEVRSQVVKCIQGNPAWFAQIVGDLPSMMGGDDISAYNAAWLLRPALNFDTGTALALVERCWIPDAHRDGMTIHTLGDLKQWEEGAIRVAETAIRRSPQQGVWVRHLEEVVVQSRPDLAPRLVAAELWGSLEKAEAQPLVVPEPPPEDAPETEQIRYAFRYGDASYAAVKKMVTDSSRWYDITKIAKSAPKSFIEQVWPWVLRVATTYVREKTRRSLSYREDHIFNDGHRFHEDLTSGLEAAIIGFADQEPDAFLAFANQNHDSELQTVHRWLAMGYCQLGRRKPQECAEYLLADSRRFALGLLENQHKETNELISAFAPYANPEVTKALEEKICNWVYYLDAPDLDAQARFDRMKSSREHRLRVLRAVPRGFLSTTTAKLLAEEERAFPNTPERDIGPVLLQHVVSPVGPEKMALASREDLIRLFDELHDGTGWTHPRDFMKGGVVEASRAFGELAKSHPGLTLLRLKDLKPGRHEHYASEAIQKLAESEQCDPGELVKVIHELSAQGFRTEVFKYGASWSLIKLAEKLHGLDDATCALLESWLEEWAVGKTDEPKTEEDSEDRHLDKNARSVLWDGGADILPQGNYPPLHALFLGYLLRKPSDANAWLSVLERHLGRHEDPRVWIGLARHELTFLGKGDRERASRLLEFVLAQPQVLGSENAARLIARLHHWLPPSLTHFCLDQWQRGSWRSGPQAAAEVAMLRHGLVPEDGYCSELVENIINGKVTNTEYLPAMRIGVTFAAAEIWGFAKARSEATRVLLAVLPCTEESMVHAWRIVFNSPWTIADDCSRQVLDAICQHREILRVPHGDHMVDRLKELLERSLEPERVCRVVTALLDECGDAVGDFRTAWAVSAGDLIDIALTLQRLPGTSLCGLQIFERLMAGNAYQIEDVLRSLDRKWPS